MRTSSDVRFSFSLFFLIFVWGGKDKKKLLIRHPFSSHGNERQSSKPYHETYACREKAIQHSHTCINKNTAFWYMKRWVLPINHTSLGCGSTWESFDLLRHGWRAVPGHLSDGDMQERSSLISGYWWRTLQYLIQYEKFGQQHLELRAMTMTEWAYEW